MRALTVLLMVGVAAMLLTAGCGPKKTDEVTAPPDPAKVVPPETVPVKPLSPLPPPRVELPPPPPKKMDLPPPAKGKTPEKVAPKVEPKKATEPAAAKEQKYTVKAGDSLSSIAKHFYNDANQWKKIADANKDKVKDKDKITVGEVLVIPAK
jgi:nucleoid-associated protein YgaU